MTERTYRVDGMSCTGCEENIVRALTKMDGIAGVQADHQAGTVKLSADGLDEAALRERIDELGYTFIGAA